MEEKQVQLLELVRYNTEIIRRCLVILNLIKSYMVEGIDMYMLIWLIDEQMSITNKDFGLIEQL